MLSLLGLSYVLAFVRPLASGLELFTRANSTRTSMALTSQALYGPFPTSTGPSPTVTRTPSLTPSPTVTRTPTSTPTPIRYFLNSPTPRMLVPGQDLTMTAGTTAPTRPNATPRPTQTSAQPRPTQVQPTDPPQQPTHPPKDTKEPKPTNPPPPTKEPKSTKESKPTKEPKPSKTPKPFMDVAACVNWQGCSYFRSEKAFYRSAEGPSHAWQLVRGTPDDGAPGYFWSAFDPST